MITHEIRKTKAYPVVQHQGPWPNYRRAVNDSVAQDVTPAKAGSSLYRQDLPIRTVMPHEMQDKLQYAFFLDSVQKVFSKGDLVTYFTVPEVKDGKAPPLYYKIEGFQETGVS